VKQHKDSLSACNNCGDTFSVLRHQNDVSVLSKINFAQVLAKTPTIESGYHIL